MGSDYGGAVDRLTTAEVLESFQVPYEITIVFARRTLERMVEYAQQTDERGVKVTQGLPIITQRVDY